MTAGMAIIISIALGVTGGLFSWRGIGAAAEIEIFSVKVRGGLGPLMIIAAIAGLVGTTWWNWTDDSPPDVIADDELEYEDWLFGEVDWCDEFFEDDPDYCASIYDEAFG